MEELESSGRIVLACRGCGERVVLLGREDDWYGDGYPAFRCSGCGERVTLADRSVRDDEAWYSYWVGAPFRRGPA